MAKKSSRRTQASRRDRAPRRHYEGPLEWLFPMLQETYAWLGPKEKAAAVAAPLHGTRAKRPAPPARAEVISKQLRGVRHEERLAESGLASVPMTHWEDQLREFKQRRVATQARVAGAVVDPARHAGRARTEQLDSARAEHRRAGQTMNRAAVVRAGRAASPSCRVAAWMYVATANGGVCAPTTANRAGVHHGRVPQPSPLRLPARAWPVARSPSTLPIPIVSTSARAKWTPTHSSPLLDRAHFSLLSRDRPDPER